MRFRQSVFAVGLTAVVLTGPAFAEWPTLHRDNQRSGYTDEIVRGPYQRKWFRSFVEEMVGARQEAIVARGFCFIGTYAGNVYSLKIDDGETAWSTAVGGPIGHSVCYDNDRVFVCTDDGYRSGSLVCLRATDGVELWRYRAEAGFWNAPACDGERVYAGDRAGVFHAVDAKTGSGLWTYRTGAMILKPASISPDGRAIVFGSEDMHVYCLSSNGQLRWKSPKLAGLSLRDAAPTIWDGKVVVRTNPSRPFHESLHEGSRLVCDIQRGIPLGDEDNVFDRLTRNQYFLRHTPRREKAEHEGILAYLDEHPHSRTWFTFDLADGTEPWIAGVMFTAGLHNPPSPPTFNPKTNELYTIMPTALGVYSDGVSQVGIGIGRIDPQTGYLTNLPQSLGDKVPGYFAGSTMIADETSTLSLMGGLLLMTHQGAVGGVDLKTRSLSTLHGVRDTYGGLFGPGAAKGSWDGSKELARQGYVQNTVNEWHGPDRSIVSISDGRMFWVAGSCVVCFAGPDVPAADGGGTRPPEPWKWTKPRRFDGGNVTTATSRYDASVAKTTFTSANVMKYLADPPIVARQDALSDHLAQRLDAAVAETIAVESWAPLVVQLGISHEDVYFARTAETMQSLAMALPHLPATTRGRTIAYLDRLFAGGVPLESPAGDMNGRRREYYDLAPETLRSVAGRKYKAEGGDLYALWAYANYADRWKQVLGQMDEIRALFDEIAAEPVVLNGDDRDLPAVETLNEQIAAAIAYGRIMRHAGLENEVRGAAELLTRLFTERVHCEQADGRLQTRRGHYARLPRYAALVPEIGHLLAEHAGRRLPENLDGIDRELPVWYQAWGERLIGGENYVSPPSLSQGVFLAMAYSGHAPRKQLARYLDQPWCRADLAHIAKLTALLQTAEDE